MQPTEVIRENDEESVVSATKKDEGELDSDEEELGRSDERINLEHVSVKSSKSTSSKQKAILSPAEVKKI